MKGVADSVLLAAANVLLSALAFLFLRMGTLSFVGLIGAMGLVPVVLLVTLIFVIRDLAKAGRRWQAILAILLSVIPVALRLSLEL